MMVTRTLEAGYDVLQTVEGQPVSGAARAKLLMKGDQMTMEKVSLENGSSLPTHKHNYETVAYVVRGKARITVGKETSTVDAGDAFRHPKGVPHSIHAVEEVTIVEVHIGS